MSDNVKTRQITIADIVVPERIRKDNGDIGALMESITARGLINPITVMEQNDGGCVLIAGLRRLEACTRLGWSKIRATVLSPMEADETLLLEIAENEQRKEFTVSERLDYAERIKAVEQEKAKLRMSEHARDGHEEKQGMLKRAYPDDKGPTRNIVAKKAGFSSPAQMERAGIIAGARPDLLKKVDDGEMSLYGAYRETTSTTEPATATTVKSTFSSNPALSSAPTQPQEKTRRKMTPEQRTKIKRIEEGLVAVNKVELDPLETLSPASLSPDGEAGTLAGAAHDELMANSVYSRLYASYVEVCKAANSARGALVFRCEGYEKQIRAYEERARSMAAELARQRTNKRDFAVDSASVRMDEDGGGITLLGGGNSERFGMTELFHRQLGSALGIPAKYYDKLRSELPSLLAENVNGWLENRADRQLIRTMDGRARAFLSDRYRRIDNYEIAEATLPLLSELEGVKVESCEVTENFMYIKAVNPRLQTEIVPGDIVQAGVMISNSEVGLGSVKVMPLVYRLVCKNGLVANDLGERKYHIGREQDGDWELFTDETLRADDTAFMLKLRDIVRSAVDEARFHSVADRLREAANVKISGYAPKVVELTATNFGFSKPESDGILNHLIEGGDLSMYGLSNAVTRASQDVESYDRATALESAGWEIVTMAPALWSALNEKG